MRVLELSLRNYRVFEEVDLELPARVIGIVGDNGAGKSTLVESIAFALYGVDAARTKRDAIRTHGVLADCQVRLVFEHAGRQYEVRRAIRGRQHAPEAELFDGGLALATGTAPVTDEVVRLLHMDLPVFRASVFAEQKQLDALSDQTAGKRKEMALRLLGIKPVDEARGAARRESKAQRQAAEQLAGALADEAELEARLKAAAERAAEAEATAGSARALLAERVSEVATAEHAFERIDEAREHAEKLELQIQGAQRERADLTERRGQLHAKLVAVDRELAQRPSLEREVEALGDAQARRDAAHRIADVEEELRCVTLELSGLVVPDADELDSAVAQAEAVLDHARRDAVRAEAERERAEAALREAEEHVRRASEADPDAPCPTCGQPLGQRFGEYVRKRKQEAAVAARSMNVATRAAEDAAANLRAAMAALDATADQREAARSLIEERSRMRATATKLEEKLRALTEPYGGRLDVEDADRAAARVAEIRRALTRLEASADQRVEAEAELETVVARLEEVDARLARLEHEASGMGFDRDRYVALKDARDRAREGLEEARHAERAATEAAAAADAARREDAAHLEEARRSAQTVSELRDGARYLERTSMLLDGFRDHLVGRVGPELSREAEALFRDLTSHEYDDLRIDDDTLAIEIADGDRYFPIARFSGSETDLANLALRVAISVHLSRVSGADIGFMVLDEVLGSLDQERKDLMVQAMGRLVSRFHQLFVVTHAEHVKDQFPAAIMVRKIGRRRSEAILV